MKTAIGSTLIPNAAVLITDGKIQYAGLASNCPENNADTLDACDVLDDISILEDRNKFIAVLQGGVIKAGQLAPRLEPQIPAVG